MLLNVNVQPRALFTPWRNDGAYAYRFSHQLPLIQAQRFQQNQQFTNLSRDISLFHNNATFFYNIYCLSLIFDAFRSLYTHLVIKNQFDKYTSSRIHKYDNALCVCEPIYMSSSPIKCWSVLHQMNTGDWLDGTDALINAQQLLTKMFELLILLLYNQFFYCNFIMHSKFYQNYITKLYFQKILMSI